MFDFIFHSFKKSTQPVLQILRPLLESFALNQNSLENHKKNVTSYATMATTGRTQLVQYVPKQEHAGIKINSKHIDINRPLATLKRVLSLQNVLGFFLVLKASHNYE